MTESIQVKQSMGARAIQEKVYNKPDWVISVPDCQKLRILWSWCWDHWHWQLYYSKKDAKERGEVWSFTKIPLNTVPHFHPLSSTFTHFHPLSPTFIHFHLLSPTFTHFHPLSPTLTHFHPLSSNLAREICNCISELYFCLLSAWGVFNVENLKPRQQSTSVSGAMKVALLWES